ncbi:MAG TPA: carboxyl transferase domain-containing protein [Baekduia sp.]|nr:carboxyl transferase domain-containing protein [Baekduia sp.]
MSSVIDTGVRTTAETRLQLLFDPGTFRSIRSAVGDGVLSGYGRVQGRSVYAWSQDGGYKGGSLGAAGGETIVRTIMRADSQGFPVVGFPHSGGARLQEGIGSLAAYSAIFRAQANARVPIISVIGGPCAGGAAYASTLGDFTIMSGEAATMFLTGPKVVEAVTGEQISFADLGGAKVHSKNGVAHLVARDDVHASDMIRNLLAHLPSASGATLPLHPPVDALPGDPSEFLPENTRQVYDVREVISRIVDAGELLELSPRWARNVVVGFARVEGSPVGVIANQARHLGGCLDAPGSEKGAWFVNMCDHFRIPLVVMVDTPGYLPGRTQEEAGVLRHGASLLRAFSMATVPRVTLTIRRAYGGAHIVMNSRDLGASLTLAWPNATIGVMGASQAVEVLGKPELAELAEGPAIDAARRGQVDEVIDPRDTRDRIAGVVGPQ